MPNGRDLFADDITSGVIDGATLDKQPQAFQDRVNAAIESAEKKEERGRDLFADDQHKQVNTPDPYKELAQDQGFFQTGAISIGRGLAKIGRALGLVEPETEAEKLAFEALGKERPFATTAGEMVGESLPFAAVPVGAIPGTAAKIAAGAGLGALEGALIARGEGRTVEDQVGSAAIGGGVSAGLEAISPVIGRIGGALFRRVTGRMPKGAMLTKAGRPTEELKQALLKTDLTFDDLADGAKDLIAKQAPRSDPGQVARVAQFKDLGIPATKGNVTQDFGQQAIEARLAESAVDPTATPLRQLMLEQSEGMTGNLDSLIEKSGVPKNIGDTMKDALSGRKALLRKQKNQLYKAAAQKAENVGGLPLPTQSLEQALPDQRTLSRLGRIQGSQSEAALDLMAEFGVDTSEDAIARIEKNKIATTQLSLGNFDDFRSAMNQIERADQTGASSVIIGPIREALDNEADDFAGILSSSGVTDENILGPLKEARKTVRKLKTEFSPQAITGKLIDVKRDGVTPIIEASKVFDTVIGTNKPIELLERTVSSLVKSGSKGKRALGDLQAATLADLMEHAFKAQTRKIGGTKTFGTVAFNKRLAQIGDEKLKLIFKSDPGAFKQLKKLSKAAENLTPASGAGPKGSAMTIIDGLISIASRTPLMGRVIGGVTTLMELGGNKSAIDKALRASPDLKQTASFINKNMPSFYDVVSSEFPEILKASAVPAALIATERKENK